MTVDSREIKAESIRDVKDDRSRLEEAYRGVAEYPREEKNRDLFLWIKCRPLNFDEFKRIGPTPDEQYARDTFGRTIFTYLRKIGESRDPDAEVARTVLEAYYTIYYPENPPTDWQDWKQTPENQLKLQRLNTHHANTRLLAGFLEAVEAEEVETAKKLFSELPKEILNEDFNLEAYTGHKAIFYLPNIEFQPPLIEHFTKLGHKNAVNLLSDISKLPPQQSRERKQSIQIESKDEHKHAVEPRLRIKQPTRRIPRTSVILPPRHITAELTLFQELKSSIKITPNTTVTDLISTVKTRFSERVREPNRTEKFLKWCIETSPPEENKTTPIRDLRAITPKPGTGQSDEEEETLWTEKEQDEALTEYLQYELWAHAHCIVHFREDKITNKNRIQYANLTLDHRLCLIEAHLRAGGKFSMQEWEDISNIESEAAKKFAKLVKEDNAHIANRKWDKLPASGNKYQGIPCFSNRDFRRAGSLISAAINKGDLSYNDIVAICNNPSVRIFTLSPDYNERVPQKALPLWFALILGREQQRKNSGETEDDEQYNQAKTTRELKWIMEQANERTILEILNVIPDQNLAALMLTQLQRYRKDLFVKKNMENLNQLDFNDNILKRFHHLKSHPPSEHQPLETDLGYFYISKDALSAAAKDAPLKRFGRFLSQHASIGPILLILSALLVAVSPFLLPGLLVTVLPNWMLSTAAGLLPASYVLAGEGLRRKMPKLFAVLAVGLLVGGIALSFFNPLLGVFLLACAASMAIGIRLPILDSEQKWRKQIDMLINVLCAVAILGALASGYGIIAIAAVAATILLVKGGMYLHRNAMNEKHPLEWVKQGETQEEDHFVPDNSNTFQPVQPQSTPEPKQESEKSISEENMPLIHATDSDDEGEGEILRL